MLATSSTTEPIRAETVRSGLVESTDEISGCIVDDSGKVIVSFGDPTRPLFYRSSIKPFQAKVTQEFGADLPPEHLAVACSSHAGSPAHLAIVLAILDGAGLDETDLQTPPGWPLSANATRLVAQQGHKKPRRLFHNCSGKHAGWLAACVAAGHDTSTYLDPMHPLQRRVQEYVADVTGIDPQPVGVDGCGAPTLRGNIVGLARAFARLAVDPELADVATACARYPALVAGSDLLHGKLAQWWPGPMKGGAEGLMACAGNGFAAVVKSHSGSDVHPPAALGEMLAAFGVLSAAAQAALTDVLAQPVLGGGRPQGNVRIVVPT
jgi:L-asparaginase II